MWVIESLTKRLPLVQQLVERGQLHPHVLIRVLTQVERDVSVLTDEKNLKVLKGEDRKQAEELGRQAQSILDDLHSLQGKPTQ